MSHEVTSPCLVFHDWEVVRHLTQDQIGNEALDRIDGRNRRAGFIRRHRQPEDVVDRVCLKCGTVDLGIERAIQQRMSGYERRNQRERRAAELYKQATGVTADGNAIDQGNCRD